MRLTALEIPDEPAELPGWIEGQMLGLDLAALVAELEAIHGDAGTEAPALDNLLGTDRAAMLERGLSALPLEGLRQFLRQPRRLLDLQELVLVEGGPHWQRLTASGPESARLDAEGWRRLGAFLTTGDTTTAQAHTRRAAARRHPWRWVAIVATAASLLGAFLVYQRSHEPALSVATAGKWGWLRPGAFPQDASPAEYLNTLAKGAEEWFNKRPEERAALTRRIAEFRLGCTVLLEAQHRPLAPQDRQWLVRTCREWLSDLDRSLAEIEARGSPVRVRDKVDETVRQIAKALRDRAAART